MGNPTYTYLQKIYPKAKANTQYVPSTLGGGSNSHLRLVTIDVPWQIITPVKKWTRTETPAALTNNTGTASVITRQTRPHNDAVTAAHKSNQVDQTTLDQILKAIDKTLSRPELKKTQESSQET